MQNCTFFVPQISGLSRRGLPDQVKCGDGNDSYDDDPDDSVSDDCEYVYET